jgi:hypothetical protein
VYRHIKPRKTLIFDDQFTLFVFSAASALTNSAQIFSDEVQTSTFLALEMSVRSYRPKPADMWSLRITFHLFFL